MPSVTISIDEEIKKIIEKRAKKNLLSLREQIEEIVRQSAVRTKTGAGILGIKADDRLVEIFSRYNRAKKKAKHGKKAKKGKKQKAGRKKK